MITYIEIWSQTVKTNNTTYFISRNYFCLSIWEINTQLLMIRKAIGTHLHLFLCVSSHLPRWNVLENVGKLIHGRAWCSWYRQTTRIALRGSITIHMILTLTTPAAALGDAALWLDLPNDELEAIWMPVSRYLPCAYSIQQLCGNMSLVYKKRMTHSCLMNGMNWWMQNHIIIRRFG